jgi:hypothetical protein
MVLWRMLTRLKSAPPPPKTPTEILAPILAASPELTECQRALESARSRREDLRRELASLARENSVNPDGARERQMLDVHARMMGAQAEIVVLRQRRADLRQPLAQAASAELMPLARSAGERIVAAVAEIEKALNELRALASEAAPLTLGGLDSTPALPFCPAELATLDARLLHPLKRFGQRARGEEVL